MDQPLPIKNTFIHFDPRRGDKSPPPTRGKHPKGSMTLSPAELLLWGARQQREPGEESPSELFLGNRRAAADRSASPRAALSPRGGRCSAVGAEEQLRSGIGDDVASAMGLGSTCTPETVRGAGADAASSGRSLAMGSPDTPQRSPKTPLPFTPEAVPLFPTWQSAGSDLKAAGGPAAPQPPCLSLQESLPAQQPLARPGRQPAPKAKAHPTQPQKKVIQLAEDSSTKGQWPEWMPLSHFLGAHRGGIVFRFTLRRADNVELGLRVQSSLDDMALQVKEVVPGGAVQAWNKLWEAGDKTWKAMMPGDMVVQVNSAFGCKDMFDECRRARLLRLVVVREANGQMPPEAAPPMPPAAEHPRHWNPWGLSACGGDPPTAIGAPPAQPGTPGQPAQPSHAMHQALPQSPHAYMAGGFGLGSPFGAFGPFGVGVFGQEAGFSYCIFPQMGGRP